MIAAIALVLIILAVVAVAIWAGRGPKNTDDLPGLGYLSGYEAPPTAFDVHKRFNRWRKKQ